MQERLYTAADLWRLSHLPENSEKRLELSAGRLIEMPLNGWLHGIFASAIDRYIRNFVQAHTLGITTAGGTGYILFEYPDSGATVRAPDAAFVSKARPAPYGLVEKYAPFAPDLAIEVVSPHDEAGEIALKVEEYVRYGTRAVWVFYPKLKAVYVHTPAGVTKLTADDTLDGGEVLSGFQLALRELFG